MNTDKKQALSVHLKAIRRMLIVSVASVAVLFVLFFYLLCGPLVDFVLAPVRARGIEVITTSVSEALMMQFKVCLIAAVIAGMPVIIWQVWVFVAPALYPQEKRLFAALFFVALLLFVGGVGTSEIGGEIKVKVTMDGDKIAKIEVLSHNETAGIADPALEQIPEAIIAAQSTSVDAITGATKTSEALIAAVNDALSQIK